MKIEMLLDDHNKSKSNLEFRSVGSQNLFKYMRRLIFAALRYPCFNHQDLVFDLYGPGVSEEERKCFMELTSNHLYKFHIFVLLIGVCVVLRSLVVGSILLLSTPRLDGETILIDDNQIYYRHDCLITNCTNYRMDIYRQFPILNLCHPYSSSHYNPTIDFNSFCLMGGLALPFILFCHGIAPILLQLVSPKGSETLLFLENPFLTRALMKSKLRRIMIDTWSSYSNYHSIWLDSKETETKSTVSKIEKERFPRYRRFQRKRDSFVVMKSQGNNNILKETNRENDYILRLTYSWNSLGDDLEDLLGECIPVIRSKWWHDLNYDMVRTKSIQLILGIVFHQYTGILLFYLAKQRIELVRRIGDRLQNSNCSVWLLDTDSISGMRLFDFERDPLVLELDIYDLVGFTITSLFVTTSIMCCLYVSYREFLDLDFLLSEVQFRADQILNILTFHSIYHVDNETRSFDSHDLLGINRIKPIFNKLKETIRKGYRYSKLDSSSTIDVEHLKVYGNICRCERLEREISRQIYVINLLDKRPPSTELVIILLEQYYFLLRILLIQLKIASIPIIGLIVCSHTTLYTVNLISLLVNHQLGPSSSQNLFHAVMFGVLFTTGLKVPPSRIEPRVG